jgi:hypothetical protein
MSVFRTDRISNKLSAPVEGPAGSLFVEGFAARPGIYKYMSEDGSVRRELVPRDALWRPDAITTLGRAPVTLEHPQEMVTDENVSKYSVGDVGSEIVEGPGGFVRIRLAVRTRKAKDALLGGKIELSPGYVVEIDATPGVDPEFGEYDAVQVKREYNHLAIVDRARGGSAMRVTMDSAVMVDPISFSEDEMSGLDENLKVDASEEEEISEEEEASSEEEPTEEAPPSEEEEADAEEEPTEEEPAEEEPASEEEEADAEEEPTEEEPASEEEEEDAEEDPEEETEEDEEAAPAWATALSEGISRIESLLSKEKEDTRIDTNRIAWYKDRVGLKARLDALNLTLPDEATNLDMATAILTAMDVKDIPSESVIPVALNLPSSFSFKFESNTPSYAGKKTPYGQG